MRALMLRTLCVVGLAGIFACSGPSRPCKADSDCGNDKCDTELGACVTTGGGGDAGGGGGGTCTPACEQYVSECVNTTCEARYSAITINSPTGTVRGGPINVKATLVLATGRTPDAPPQLQYDVTPKAGGASLASGALNPSSAQPGEYTATLTALGAGQYTIKVSAGSLSAQSDFTVDATAPTFVVSVPARDAGAATATTNYVDPDPQYTTAWRRDQIVPVEIRSVDTDVAGASIVLIGTDGGRSPDFGASPLSPCDAGYCGVAQVKLYSVEMNAFRTPMQLEVTGTDQAGNVANADGGSVKVTRWKWDFNTGVALRVAPAIGPGGVVYVGNSVSAASGNLVAVIPDGTLKWALPTGSITSSPAVGFGDGGQELVYYSAIAAQGSVSAVDAADAGSVGKCSANATAISGIALTSADSGFGPVETVVTSLASGSTGRVMLLRAPLDQVDQCAAVNTPPTNAAAPIAVAGNTVFVPQGRSLNGYVVGTSTTLGGFPADAGFFVTGLAINGSQVIGSGGDGTTVGGVFSIPMAGASSVSPIFPAGLNGRVNNFVISKDQRVIGGVDSSGTLFSASLLDGGTSTGSSVGTLQGAGVLGSDGVFYAANTSGELRAWSPTLSSPIWSLTTDLPIVEASLTLDCPRDSAGNKLPELPGVLYVAGTDGKLYSFIVDSRGIDINAKWPKWQHDPRNTGNADVSLSEFSCP